MILDKSTCLSSLIWYAENALWKKKTKHVNQPAIIPSPSPFLYFKLWLFILCKTVMFLWILEVNASDWLYLIFFLYLNFIFNVEQREIENERRTRYLIVTLHVVFVILMRFVVIPLLKIILFFITLQLTFEVNYITM